MMIKYKKPSPAQFWQMAGIVCWGVAAQAAEVPGMSGSMHQQMENDSRRLLQDNSRRFDAIIQQQRLRQMLPDSNTMHRPEAAEMGEMDCLRVKGVRLAGIKLLSRKEVASLGELASDCLNNEELNRYSRALTQLYLKKGYIAARVAAEGPDEQGVLILRVHEGRVEKIVSDDRRSNPATLFPGVLGRPLNIHDADQGLDQANRLPSSKATLDILPGETVGGSILSLRNNKDAPWRLNFNADNTGRDSTGRVQAGVGLSWDSPLGLSDFVSVSAQRTSNDNAVRHSRSESLFYSLPYGYWTFSAFASRADYLNPLQLQYSAVNLSGRTAQSGLRVDRVLSRGQDQTTSLMAQLTHKRVRNYFLDSEIEITSPTLSVAELGLSRLQLLSGGVLIADAGVQRGTRWLGASAPDPRAPDGPNPQFTKWKASLNWFQSLGLPGGPYQLNSALTGQTSRDYLPGVEQMDVSDASAVRGFRRNTLAGETGWSWRNTLSRRFELAGVGVTPRIGLDGGRVLPHRSVQQWQSIAGASLGLVFSYRKASLDLEYSRPLYKPAGWQQEGHQLFAKLALSW